MREFRMSKRVTEHYTSLEEMGRAWGCKSVTKKQPKDEKVLQEKREEFLAFFSLFFLFFCVV